MELSSKVLAGCFAVFVSHAGLAEARGGGGQGHAFHPYAGRLGAAYHGGHVGLGYNGPHYGGGRFHHYGHGAQSALLDLGYGYGGYGGYGGGYNGYGDASPAQPAPPRAPLFFPPPYAASTCTHPKIIEIGSRGRQYPALRVIRASAGDCGPS